MKHTFFRYKYHRQCLCNGRRQRGFTLLELLVSLSIYALLSAMAYGGLNTVMRAQQATTAQAERLAALQKTFFWLGRDITQAIDRSIRGEYGDLQPAMIGLTLGERRLELTRNGWRNPVGRKRSNLQRVAWGLRDEKLLRLYWNVLDRAEDSKPLETEMLDGVEKLKLRFLDDKQKWHDAWPALSRGRKSSVALPRAVEVTLETEREGRIKRVFLVAGK